MLAHGAKAVKTFLPLSGDYWAVCMKGGKDYPRETVDALLQNMENAGVAPRDVRILAATGDGDIAFEALDPMMKDMAARPEFTLDEIPGNGNLCYLLKTGGTHCYQHCWEYIWQLLPYVFPEK